MTMFWLTDVQAKAIGGRRRVDGVSFEMLLEWRAVFLTGMYKSLPNYSGLS